MNRPPHKKWGIIAGVAVVAIMVSFVIAAVSTKTRRHNFNTTITEQQHTDAVICERVNRLYRAIQKQVRIAIAANPKIAYYHTHPADLARVQQQLNQELAAFEPQPCPADPMKEAK